MNLLWRLLFLLLRVPFQKKVDPLSEISTPFRCWPTDLDVNFHMNNGKYFSILDLGRLDLIFRTGNLPQVLRSGLKPMVIEESMRFRKSIQLFQKFRVCTRIVGWKGQDLFLEQKFLIDGKGSANGPSEATSQVCAWAFIRARIVAPGKGSLPAEEVVRLFGYNGPQIDLPSNFQAWSELPKHQPLRKSLV